MKKAQTAIEYMVLVIIIAGALLMMQVYIMRGLSGGWRRAVDEVGDQYHPANTNQVIVMSYSSNQTANIILEGNIQNCEANGCNTRREDFANTYMSTSTTANIGGY